MSEERSYGIAELAREFGVTPRAIRFYEDGGLLAPARTGRGGRTRVYSQRDRTRLQLVLRGKRLGLSLGEVKGLLDMYETPADTVPQLTRFLELLARHRKALQQQVADLRSLIGDIDRQRNEAERVLAGLRSGKRSRADETAAPDVARRSASAVRQSALPHGGQSAAIADGVPS
jgi:DNA-binding transcriptional MerR regulator